MLRDNLAYKVKVGADNDDDTDDDQADNNTDNICVVICHQVICF